MLSSPELITGFCIITKRMDTGSPWIISNNPRAPYWEDGKNHIGNKSYPLVNLVRASTAAPHFFDPELLPISQNEAALPDDDRKTAERAMAGARLPRDCCKKSGCARRSRSIRMSTASLSTAA